MIREHFWRGNAPLILIVARLAHERQMTAHVRLVERGLEEEPQRRDRTVHRRRLHASLALMDLIPAQVLRRSSVGRAAEEQ